MSEHPLFETVDPVALDRVTNALGETFMGSAKGLLDQLANDDTIPPDALLAGMVKAHLAGAVAGMYQASRSAEGRVAIVADAADWLTKRLEELEEQSAAIAAAKRSIVAAIFGSDQAAAAAPANDL